LSALFRQRKNYPMPNRLYLLVSALLIILSPARAQFSYFLYDSIPVQKDNKPLSMPWAGGLNAAQYSTLDVNLDNKEDIVVFDRMANKVITFLNIDGQYQYAPQYENSFPDGITNWLLMRDYNCDGKKDIFTGDILGMKVYTNVTQPDSLGPQWEQYLFYSGDGNTPSKVLLTKGFTNLINLQLQFDDLPAIVDADGDGDLDIFTVQFVGNGTIEFHENITTKCDTLKFQRVTRTWGGITECTCGNFAFNNQPCPTRTEHAGGKSLLAIDATGDGQIDIMLSEATCTTMSLLANDATLFDAVVSSSSLFPGTRPVSLVIYPAAYYEDVDFDGVKDLLTTPNVYLDNYFNSDFEHSNWFYKNTGTNAAPVFSLKQTDFLQEHMIDVGENAVPAFFDVDNDGDQDMLVSHFTSDRVSSRIRLFENTGTRSHPAFELADDDYLGFSLSTYYNLRIKIIDLNNDGKQDLVFTATSVQDATTHLYYMANKASTSLDFSGQDVQQLNFNLASPENLHLVDISGDGLLDILAGRSDGSLEYWKNNGPVANPSFSSVNKSYLGIGPSVTRQNLTAATGDLDANGTLDLILGDQTGQIRIISSFREVNSSDNEQSDIIYNPLLGTSDQSEAYEVRNLGGRIWPTVVNLFNANKPAIIVGNTLGGLAVLKHSDAISFAAPTIEVYPNPIAKNDDINIEIDGTGTVQFFAVTGRAVSDPITITASRTEPTKLKVPNLAAGVYILRFTLRDQTFAKRVVIY